MPFSAADATKRRAKSASTGREPTRKRPRSASPSGVFTRAFSARMRSHGLSTPRLTAASKQPPPETSRYAKPGAVEDLGEPELLGGRHRRPRAAPARAGGWSCRRGSARLGTLPRLGAVTLPAASIAGAGRPSARRRR